MVESNDRYSHSSPYLVWSDTQTRCDVHYDVQLEHLTRQAKPSTWFNPDLPMLDATSVKEGGRAAAWFIRLGDTDAVLRQYRRGGIAAHFARDQYFWRGAEQARSFAEFSLLQKMQKMGLPVPRPLAAFVQRKGLIYRAALITERIPGAQHPQGFVLMIATMVVLAMMLLILLWVRRVLTDRPTGVRRWWRRQTRRHEPGRPLSAP